MRTVATLALVALLVCAGAVVAHGASEGVGDEESRQTPSAVADGPGGDSFVESDDPGEARENRPRVRRHRHAAADGDEWYQRADDGEGGDSDDDEEEEEESDDDEDDEEDDDDDAEGDDADDDDDDDDDDQEEDGDDDEEEEDEEEEEEESDDDDDEPNDDDEDDGDGEDGGDGRESDQWEPLIPTFTPTPESTPAAAPTRTQTPTPSPAFEVVDASLGRSEVSAGEYVTVTATVENRGDEDGTHEVDLRVDGGAVATKSVRIPAGESASVEFQLQRSEPGTYDVAVDGAPAGTLAVRSREAAGEDVEVVDAVVPADRVRPGVETTVRATVENPEDRAVNTTLNVTVDGQRVASVEVPLSAGERTEVTIPFEATGGSVAVDGVAAGRLAVDESLGQADDTGAGSSERAGTSFGVLAAAGVILSAVLVAAVSWRHRGEGDEVGRR